MVLCSAILGSFTRNTVSLNVNRTTLELLPPLLGLASRLLTINSAKCTIKYFFVTLHSAKLTLRNYLCVTSRRDVVMFGVEEHLSAWSSRHRWVCLFRRPRATKSLVYYARGYGCDDNHVGDQLMSRFAFSSHGSPNTTVFPSGKSIMDTSVWCSAKPPRDIVSQIMRRGMLTSWPPTRFIIISFADVVIRKRRLEATWRSLNDAPLSMKIETDASLMRPPWHKLP